MAVKDALVLLEGEVDQPLFESEAFVLAVRMMTGEIGDDLEGMPSTKAGSVDKVGKVDVG